jgi:hypothetical protein
VDEDGDDVGAVERIKRNAYGAMDDWIDGSEVRYDVLLSAGFWCLILSMHLLPLQVEEASSSFR